MPHFFHYRQTSSRIILSGLVVATMLPGFTGCSALWPGKSEESDQAAVLQELMKAPDLPDRIRDATAPHGMHPIQVQGVGVVNGLPSTGGPPDPSQLRDELLDEMKRHDIANPNRFLETSDTALVKVMATIPPGARRGEPIDIRVLAPKVSRATDLRGGWLLDTRLRQQQLLNQMVRKSEVMALGTGLVLSRADYSPGADGSLKLEGAVLSGGRVQETRKLGLVLKPSYHHAKIASSIAIAINQRFFFFDGTTRRGIAKAIEDDFVELDMHPRYRNNVYRFMHVVRAIGGKAESSVNQEKLAALGDRLRNPATASDAALQLEAIGENAVPTLVSVLQTDNPELRFYAAEALAYLDRTEAIEPLEAAIRDEPAMRHSALLALEGFNDPSVIDTLLRLTDAASLEARYGAFCALRRRDDGRRKLVGKPFSSFTLFAVPSSAEPTIVVSLRESPEVVLFGRLEPLKLSKPLVGPSGLMLTPDEHQPDELKIVRFQSGIDDQRVSVSNSIASVIKGISDVGGNYGDVIAILRAAKGRGDLANQLAIDPLPKSQRIYYRNTDEDEEEPHADESVGSGAL